MPCSTQLLEETGTLTLFTTTVPALCEEADIGSTAALGRTTDSLVMAVLVQLVSMAVSHLRHGAAGKDPSAMAKVVPVLCSLYRVDLLRATRISML